jgi:YHS domain-containing protein
MGAHDNADLASRLDAVIGEAHGKVKAFQEEAEAARQETRARFERFMVIAEQVVVLARGKLERLKEQLEVEVTPAHLQTERFYSRSVTFDVKTELAGVVKLGFRLTHDSDVRRILLDYNLDITPAFFRFNPHARLEVPLEAYDEAAVGTWLDDRIIEFAKAYLELHDTKQHQERAMVSDPVAGISFPKHFAAATLEHDGTTHYFVSEESRREFAKQHGPTP